MLPNGKQKIDCAKTKFLKDESSTSNYPIDTTWEPPLPDSWNPPTWMTTLNQVQKSSNHVAPSSNQTQPSKIKSNRIHGKCDQVETDPWQVTVAEHTHSTQHTHRSTHMWTHSPRPRVRRSEVRRVRTWAVRRCLHTHPCVDTHSWAHLVRRAEAGQWVVRLKSL